MTVVVFGWSVHWVLIILNYIVLFDLTNIKV